MDDKQIKAGLARLRISIDAAFAKIAKEHGLEALKTGRMTYDHEGNFSVKVEGLMPGGVSKERGALEMLRQYPPGGYKIPAYGDRVQIREKTFRIIGANSRLTKLIATDEHGKPFDIKLESFRTERLKGYIPAAPAAGGEISKEKLQ